MSAPAPLCHRLRARFGALRAAVVSSVLLAAAAPSLHAEPPAADIERARTFIEGKLTAEQRTALENLARVEGKEPARLLIELFGARVLGGKTPWPGEPSVADREAARREIAAMSAPERARAEAEAKAAGRTLEVLIAEQLSRGTRGEKSTSSSEPSEAVVARPAERPASKAVGMPILEVDTGGHIDRVKGLAFSADGAHLYSAGHDKLVRIWNVYSGQTVETRRGQISERKEGELYALALSPDGGTLAVGGLLEDTSDDGSCISAKCGDIRLFDARLATEREGLGLAAAPAVHTHKGHRSIVLTLAYSPDGALLASAGADRELALWRAGDHAPLGRLTPAPKGERASGERLVWLADGRAIALVNNLPAVQIIDVAEPQRPKVLRTLDAGEPLKAVATSPDGRFVAAGSSSGAIHVWRWPEGELYRTFPGDGAPVSVMAFGRGSSATAIVTGPGRASPDGRYLSRVVDVVTGSDVRFAAHDNISTAIAVAPDGETVATAGGRANDIHLWRLREPAPGQRLVGRATALYAAGFLTRAPERPAGSQADAAPDFLYVAWGSEDPCPGVASCPETMGALLTALEIPSATAGELGYATESLPFADRAGRSSRVTARQAVFAAGGARLVRSTTAADGSKAREADRYPFLSIRDRDGTREILRRGTDKGLDHVAYSFDPSGQRIASAGRNGEIDVLGRDGRPLWSGRYGSGDIFALSFDPAGRLIATANGDATLRLVSAATGRLVATLLPLIDGNWIIWTPQGYFTASTTSASENFGWHVNNGRDQPASFITGDAARSLFNQPSVVQEALRLADAEAAVEQAVQRGDIRPIPAEALKSAVAPVVKILSPSTSGVATTSRAAADIAIAWPRDQQQAGEYRLTLNGRRVRSEDVVTARTRHGDLEGLTFSGLRLRPGPNTVVVEAVNTVRIDALDTTSDGIELNAKDTIVIRRDSGADADELNTLYLVAIGIDRYPDVSGCGRPGASCHLDYAGRDAIGFLERARRQLVGSGKGHGQIVTRLLVNEEAAVAAGVSGTIAPTKQNILSALKLLSEARYSDTAILFIAGHGIQQKGYYLLPTDARRTLVAFDDRSLVPWSGIEAALQAAGGERLLFLDTCRSVRGEARAAKHQSVRDQAERARGDGVVVFASTTGEQDAFEDHRLKHGLFTHAVIEALDGRADIFPADRQIYLHEIDTFVKQEVMRLTRDRPTPQEPQLFIPAQGRSSVLVRLPPP